MTENELIIMAQNGDTDAFSELYIKYKDRLFKYAYLRLGDIYDAEDAVQSCVVSAFQQIGQLRQAEAFPKWIFCILHCYCLTQMSKKFRQKNVEDIDNYVDIEATNSNDFIEDQELKEVLNTLSEKERNIVLLSTVAGFKGKEIAKITGYSHANVRTILHRALAKMKSQLIVGGVDNE